MTSGPTSIDSWFEFIVWLLLVTVPTITTVLLANRAQSKRSASKHSQLAEDVTEVKDQVKNSHRTNLRDDLDRLTSIVESLAADIRGLRNDVEFDRGERRQHRRDIKDRFERIEEKLP